MKHILMATTALVSAAGIASADVSLSGWAEMGMVGGNGGETEFHQDIDVTFKMSGETDGGLSFSAAVDLDENNAFATNTHGGSSINVSGGFGSLTLGDTDGALDWALTEGGNVKNGGSLADNETTHAGYRGSYLDGNEDGQILRYDNTMGSLAIAASIEMDEGGTNALSTAAAGAAAAGTMSVRNTFVPAANGATATAAAGATVVTAGNVAALTEGDDSSTALGVKYNMDLMGGSLALGAGYQVAAERVTYVASGTGLINGGAIQTSTLALADTTAVGFSATYAASSGFSIGVAMTEYDDFAGVNARVSVAADASHGAAGAIIPGYLTDASHLSVGVGFTTGAVTLHANYGEMDYDATAIADVDGYGVSVAYDMGGGAQVKLGMNDNATGDDFSFGLAMSF
jgi:outer membrane protein OmpU